MNDRRIPRLAAWSACAWALALGSAWADKPDFAGHGKPRWEQHESRGQSDHPGPEHRPQGHGHARDESPTAFASGDSGRMFFADRHRRSVQDFYAPRVAAGKCPPGLARKANGCLPPGQARKWAMGQALAPDLVWYPVPVELQRRLGTPPPGYRFVRVASDILLIAIGTRMVVDAIEDLGRL